MRKNDGFICPELTVTPARMMLLLLLRRFGAGVRKGAASWTESWEAFKIQT